MGHVEDQPAGLQAGGSGGRADSGVLILYPRAVGVLLPYVLVYLAGAAAAVLLGLTAGGMVWQLWALLAWLVVLTGVRLWLMRAVVRPEWSVRIDAEGVTWFGAEQPLAWSAIVHLVVKAPSRPWRVLGIYGEVGLIDHTSAAFARRAHTSPMRHRIQLRLLKGDVEGIIDTISRHAPHLTQKLG